MFDLLMLAQSRGGGGGGAIAGLIGLVSMLVPLAILAVFFVSAWKVFTKAGKPGWAVIVPIYNIIVMLEIAGKPIWWIVLYFIPCVSIVAVVLVNIAIAEKFGKGAGMGILMTLLIGWPILAFSNAEYQGEQLAG